jgi:gamma-glutamylputrescine oxidase
VRKRIVTPGARLRANHVVLCGNVQLGALMPRLEATLLPMTTYVITTAPLGEPLAEAVRFRGAVSDTDFADNHYRIVGGDRLMLSGRATAWRRNPQRYVRALTADIKQTFPQLGEVAADYAWSGTLGLTLHRMPQIGELGPGVWLASGFGGHGLNTTAMAGNIIARAIVEGDETWRQFSSFELVWAGGIFGRVASQLRVFIKRTHDGIKQRRAKARELTRRQANDAEPAAELPQPEMPAPEMAAEKTPPRTAGLSESAEPAPAASPTLESKNVSPEAGVEGEIGSAPPQDSAPAPSGRKGRRRRAKV